MAPLFMENAAETRKKTGQFLTAKKGHFTVLQDNPEIVNSEAADRLWNISLLLCRDEQTRQIAFELETK